MKAKCWSYEAIPPFSCLRLAAILNPIADSEPLLVIQPKSVGMSFWPNDLDTPGYPGDRGTGYTKSFLSSTLLYGGSVGLLSDWRGMNLCSYLYTNGPIAVPAKTIFYCDNLLSGVHWLRYDSAIETAFPETDERHFALWYSPTATDWGLTPSGAPLHVGVNFRRVGYPDLVARCVPVVMESYNYVHTDEA